MKTNPRGANFIARSFTRANEQRRDLSLRLCSAEGD